eukprot:s3762_g9.t1
MDHWLSTVERSPCVSTHSGPLAYRICLETAFLSPFYTGSEIDGPADEATMETLAAAHQAIDETVSRMREQMTLKTEESAMAKFRTAMKNAERFKRCLRMDSEGLSMLLAKVTLTTCYGIPRKGEIGYISEDEDHPERTTKAKMGKWNEVDPIGMVEPKHHTDRGYQAIGRKTKESIDNDMGVEQDFFQQAEGKIPRGVVDDPAYGEVTYDIFESLPDELEVTPDDLHTVRSPRVSAPAHATRVSPQASTRTSALAPEIDENRPRVAPTRCTTAPTQGDGSQRPREPEMPPPRGPPQRRVTTRVDARLAHTDGDIIRVSGRAPYADELRLPTPIRIKTVVPMSGLNNPTIEGLYQMYHSLATLPMVKKQVEDTLAKLNAQPDDDINCGLAGVVLQSAPMRAPSTASESTSPAEQINTGFTGTSGRTQLQRTEDDGLDVTMKHSLRQFVQQVTAEADSSSIMQDAKKFRERNWSGLSKKELEEECVARGLGKKGSKEDLVQKLIIFQQELASKLASEEAKASTASKGYAAAPAAAAKAGKDDDDDDDEEVDAEEMERQGKREKAIQKALRFLLTEKCPDGFLLGEVVEKLEMVNVRGFAPEKLGYKTTEKFVRRQPEAVLRYRKKDQMVLPPRRK